MFPALWIRRTVGRVMDGVGVGGTGTGIVCGSGDPIRRSPIGRGWTGLHDWTCTNSLSGV